MSVLHRARRLARLAGGTALTLGIASAAAANAPAAFAEAQSVLPVVNRHAAMSWGDNAFGNLGNGTTTNRDLPGAVKKLGTGVVQVSAGGFHGLAVTSNGTVWAWGENNAGELGNGTKTSSSTPVQVTGMTGVIQVAAGNGFSLALRSNGTVWAWGTDTLGQLGNGVTRLTQVTPVEVTGLTGVAKIAAGSDFSLALRSDGTVWAWGHNAHGELGNGTTVNSSVPARVSNIFQVTGIAAGADASLATRTSSTGTQVWAWGANADGQLGDGTTTDHHTPEHVTGIGTANIASIAMGGDFAVVLGTDGSVWGWGRNQYCELGSRPSSPVLRPVKTIGPGSGITQLSAGNAHVLALKSDGTVLAWGLNSDGQLGDGSTASHIGPVQVTGLGGASQVSAGGLYSLAVYLPPQYR
jgi:alpha-tubulin suppressor-like RCC1 family protein